MVEKASLVKAKILVVESNNRDRGLLEVSLKKERLSVASLSSPEEALSIIDVFAPDLIISNTRFPGKMNGFEFCRIVKSNPAFKYTPFIFLTPDKSLNSKIKGLELGADDYLVKPIYLRELIARVKLLLAKKEKEDLELLDSKKMFHGSLEDMSLVDLIQTMELGRKTGIIYLYKGGMIGKIYFSEGKVINAILGDVVGEEAIYRMFLWSEGTFKIEFRDVSGIEETINSTTQAIIMEGMRRLDEIERYNEQLPPLTTRLTVDNEAILESKIEKFPPEVEEIMLLCDGERSIEEVLHETKVEQLKAVEVISTLYFEGFLIPVAEDKDKTGSFSITQFDLFDVEKEEESSGVQPPEIPPDGFFSNKSSEGKKELFELAPPEESEQGKGGAKRGGRVIPFPSAPAAEVAPEVTKGSPAKEEAKRPPSIKPAEVYVTGRKKGPIYLVLLVFILAAVGGAYYYFSNVSKGHEYLSPDSINYSTGIEYFLKDTPQDYLLAEKFFKKMRSVYPSDWRISYFLALIKLREGDLLNKDTIIEKGWEDILSLYGKMKDNPYVRGAYAEGLMIMGDFDGARKIINRIIKSVKYYQFFYVLGDSFLREYASDPQVEKYLTLSVRSKHDFVRGLFELGRLYFVKGDYNDSLRYFYKVVKYSPNHPQIYSYLGRALYRKSSYSLAVTYLKKAVKYNSDENLNLLLGKIYVENFSDYSSGLHFLSPLWKESRSQVIRLEAGYLIAKVLIDQGESKKALPILKELYSINPLFKDVSDLIKKVAKKRKIRRISYKEVVKKATPVKKVAPNNTVENSKEKVSELLKKGSDAYEKDNLDLAYQYLSKAIRFAPSDYRTYLLLGKVLEDMGRINEAVAAFRKVIYLNPQTPEAHLHLGGLYFSIGRKKLAVKEYREYLSLSPNGAHASEVRRILRELEGG